MSGPSQNASRPKEADFEFLVANLFRRAGWEIFRPPPGEDLRADLIVDSGKRKYVIEFKRSSEGRRDRLIPLLSQAILQARTAKRRLSKSSVPVAVVAADRIPDSAAEQLKEFARAHAPEVAVGIIDLEGFRAFQGSGLERFNAERAAPSSREWLPKGRPPVDLFSDLNQWMLKVLLAPKIPVSMLSAPRERYRNAAQLARAAEVSVMSASRFVRRLSNEGYLDNRKGCLELVCLQELLERWRGASYKTPRQVRSQWIVRGGNNQLRSAVETYAARRQAKSPISKRVRRSLQKVSLPRICVGLFGAAELLGVGFVRGVAPHLYLERLDAEALRQLGLTLEGAERNPDVQIQISENKESLFRPVVWRAGIPVADIVQIWLVLAAPRMGPLWRGQRGPGRQA
jgi:hypothetical protein